MKTRNETLIFIDVNSFIHFVQTTTKIHVHFNPHFTLWLLFWHKRIEVWREYSYYLPLKIKEKSFLKRKVRKLLHFIQNCNNNNSNNNWLYILKLVCFYAGYNL